VNVSGVDFVPEEGAVRFGLGGVKNGGRGAIEAIVAARDRLDGRFIDFYEFCEEIDHTQVNRRVIEALILAGALDSVEGRREQKLAALDLALARAQRLARDRNRGQASLFGSEASSTMGESSVLPDAPEWDHRERLRKEREVLGVYLSGHPLDGERLLLTVLAPTRSVDTSSMEADRFVALCGMLRVRSTLRRWKRIDSSRCAECSPARRWSSPGRTRPCSTFFSSRTSRDP
jgi:DNA polymerase-3 subunit alpha